MPEIEIKRKVGTKVESFAIDVDKIEDLKVIFSLISTEPQRRRIIREVKAALDKQAQPPPPPP